MNIIQNPVANWDIIERPIYSNNAELNGYKAIFRNDNDTLLNVAKQTYTPTSNQRFIEVVERLNEITGFPIRCYDEFQNGKKILAYLECTEPIEVQGFPFKDYMLIGNSHDSSTGFFIGNSSQMIRCSNRFSAMFRQLQVRHTRNHDAEIDQIIQCVDAYMKQRRKLFDKMERFADVHIDEEIKNALIARLVNMTDEEKLGNAELSSRKKNLILDIDHSILTECNALGDNLFGLFNGVTHYTTHTRKSKEEVFCNALGGGAKLNDTAFEFCESFLN
jgi:hypothetical protein